MAVYVCRNCDHEAEEKWEAACPRCGGFYRAKLVGTSSVARRTTFARADKAQWSYTPTGVEGFDRVLGGGLVAGCSILMGGFKGAGKTTMLSMVADAVAKKKGKAIYASSEEDEQGVLSVAHRAGLTGEGVIVLGGQRVVERVIRISREEKAFLTVYDSLQKYVSEFSGGQQGSGSQERAVAFAIADHCRKTKTCAIIVNQMDKKGELKGGTDAAHEVEVVLVLAYVKDDDEDAPRDEADVRVLLCDGKNRRGPDNVKTYWRMTDEGRLEVIQPRSKLLDFSSARRRKKKEEDAD